MNAVVYHPNPSLDSLYLFSSCQKFWLLTIAGSYLSPSLGIALHLYKLPYPRLHPFPPGSLQPMTGQHKPAKARPLHITWSSSGTLKGHLNLQLLGSTMVELFPLPNPAFLTPQICCSYYPNKLPACLSLPQGLFLVKLTCTYY